jgi:hypothetical protein
MTVSINVDRARTLVRQIVDEAQWISSEVTELEAAGCDEGLGARVREICTAIATTAAYDVRSELDSLSDRLADPTAGDPEIPARLALNWLRADIEPLVQLALPPESDQTGLLVMLLWTGAGEIVMRFNAVRAELDPLLAPVAA